VSRKSSQSAIMSYVEGAATVNHLSKVMAVEFASGSASLTTPIVPNDI
jgi:hypothetical protein